MIPEHLTYEKLKLLPMETAALVNIVATVLIIIGVYKNKIDNNSKIVDKYAELDNRLARLEEKINFIINSKLKENV